MKFFKFLIFVCVTICFNKSNLNAEKFDDLLKMLEEEEEKANETPVKEVSYQTKNTSNIQRQVSELTEELRKLNTELKKVTGPESEKQIAESKKKRQDREKEWERASKERRSTGSGKYYPSSHGSSRGYGDYGSAGHGYTPSRGKSYSSGGFGDGYGTSPWGADFGLGKTDKDKEQTKDAFGKGSSEDNLKLNDTDKNKKDKHKKGGSSKLKKDTQSAINKVKGYTDSIKETLRQVLRNLDEIQPTQQQTIEARDKNYSNILTEDESLSELKSLLDEREEATRMLSQELNKKQPGVSSQGKRKVGVKPISQDYVKKQIEITPEERSLWNKLLTHLTRMLVFVPETEGIESISPQGAKSIRALIRNLEKGKLISPSSIKSEQEKVESEIASRIQKLKAENSNGKDISEENNAKIAEIASRVKNFYRAAQHAELKALAKPTKKDNPSTAAKKEDSAPNN